MSRRCRLSILIWLPARLSRSLGALLVPRARWRRGVVARAARSVALGARGLRSYIADFDPARGGLQYVTDEMWISELGIHYKLGLDGLNLFLRRADDAAVRGRDRCAANLREWERPRLFYFHFGLGRVRRARRASAPRTSRCSSRSST